MPDNYLNTSPLMQITDNQYILKMNIGMGEKEMIKAILEGDQKAFKLLVDTYQVMVVNTCHAFIHDRDEAEDIAQDVFIQVFESLGKFRIKRKLSTCIYRIAVNWTIYH